MSTIGNNIVPCEAFQTELDRYLQTCPSSRRPQTPFLIWSNLPENKSGLINLVNPQPGKKFTARLTYDQPRSMSDVTEVASCDKVCDATTKVGDTYMDVTFECTDGLTIEEKITLTDWMESCKSFNGLIARKIMNMLDALIPAVAEKQAQELNPLIGAYSVDVPQSWQDANDFLVVQTQTTGGTALPQWFERVNAAKVATNYCGPTIIAGGLDIWTAWRLMNVGCCTSDGLDVPALLARYGEAVVYDRWIAQEFGNNFSLMAQSNSIQFLNPVLNLRYIDFPTLENMDLGLMSAGWLGIIQDPISGMFVDVNIKVDCGDVHIVMTATTKTVGLPNDLYPAGHPNEFVTFVNGIAVDNTP